MVKLLAAMVQGLDCPITAKIRALPNDEDTIALCREIEKCGVQMITVHGRTVESSKMFTGPANWVCVLKYRRETVYILMRVVLMHAGHYSQSEELRKYPCHC